MMQGLGQTPMMQGLGQNSMMQGLGQNPMMQGQGQNPMMQGQNMIPRNEEIEGNPMMFPNFPTDTAAGMNHPGTNNMMPGMNVIAKAPSATTVSNNEDLEKK